MNSNNEMGFKFGTGASVDSTILQADQLLYYIGAIHDISTPNDKRVEYSKKIESLKDDDPAQTIPLAFQLVLYNADLIRQVGWNIIEYFIKYRWQQLQPELRQKIQQGILEHVSQGNFSMGSNDLYLRTVISRCVVEIMKHEWPHNWSNLFSQFQNVVGEEDKLLPQCQMVFTILRRLIEDVLTLSVVEDPTQKKRLSTAITDHVPRILEMTIARIRLCLIRMNDEQSILLAKSAIELLSEIVEWVVTKILDEYVDGIVDVVCAYLQTAEFGIYEEAARCLWKLASRKCVKTSETPIVVSVFRDAPMTQILTAANLAAEVSASSPDHYKYLKSLSNLLCALGVHLADIWTYIMKPPPNFKLYLDALSAFFIHPSLYIRSDTAQVLATFCGHERISTNVDFLACIKSLFQYVPRSMQRIGAPSENDSLTAHYSRMDYDGDDEFTREFIQLRDRCLKLIRDATPQHHDVLLLIVRQWITERFCFPEKVEPTEWEAMKRFITCLMGAGYGNDAVVSSPEKKDHYRELFDTIIHRISLIPPLTHPSLLNNNLSILSAFLPVINDWPDRIAQLLIHLKQFLSASNADEDIEVTSLKRHCIALLLKLISSFSDAIKPYAQAIFNLVNEVADHVSMMQRASLIHVLAALSNFAGSPEEQAAFLTNALSASVQFFALDSDAFLASVPAFLAFVGVSEPPPSDPAMFRESQFYPNRLRLKAHLSTIDGSLAQVNPPSGQGSNPLFPILLSIIPKFFQLNKILNDMNLPENVARIHPHYGPGILELTSWERHQILSTVITVAHESGSESGELRESGSQTQISSQLTTTSNAAPIPSSSESPLSYLRRLISEVNDFTQNIVAQLASKCSNEFYALSTVQNLLACSISALPSIPAFRLRIWLRRAWTRIASSCPVEHSQSVVFFSITLSRHLEQTLAEQWNTVQQICRSGDSDPTEEEIFAETLLTLLSRDYVNFLAALVVGEGNIASGLKRDISDLVTPLGRVLFAQQEVLNAVTSGLVQLMGWPDSQAALRASVVLNVIVGNFSSQFEEQTALYLLIQGIKSLQMHCQDELVQGPLLNMIFNIYATLRPRYASMVDVLKQIPDSVLENIENFDNKIMAMASAKAAENLMPVSAGDGTATAANKPGQTTERGKRDLMRKVLKTVITQRPSERHRIQPAGGRQQFGSRQQSREFLDTQQQQMNDE